MSDKLVITAGLEGVNSRKDNTMSLRFSTQELTTTEKMKILEAQNGFGILVFKYDNESLTQQEIDELDQIEVDLYDNNKTQSQRIRAVLWRLFEQDELKGHESEELKKELFKDFYRTKTEQIISHFKTKLEP